MNRILPVAIISLVIFAFAFYMGWLSYQSNSFGMFIYTAIDWCDSHERRHSFSLVYELILIAVGVVVAISALISWLVFYFTKNSKVKYWSQRVSYISLLLLIALMLLFLISPVFEAIFPLQPDPNCKQT